MSRKLEALDDPVSVGVIGTGMFGSQVIYAVEAAPGMRVAAVADIDPDKAVRTLANAGVAASDIAECETGAAAERAAGRAVLTAGAELVEMDLDVVVEATGVPEIAAEHACAAIEAGTDFVNVSVETDTVVGPALADLARRAGVTYSMAYGDQPAKIVELYDWARTNGFEVVAAGRTSGDVEPHGTPDDALERHRWIGSFVEEYDPDPTIYNTFLDGTKVAVESCAIANALGLRPDVRGMHRPDGPLADAPAVLRPEADGGVLGRTGVVDCLNPADDSVSGFVVTRTDNEALRQYLERRSSVPTAGGGAYQLFHVPYHNAQETTVSVARAALYGEPTGVVRSQEAEVVAAAKRTLAPGDEIDGAGGYTVYGVLEDADVAAEAGHVPLELLAGATVRREVETDEIVAYDDVSVETDSLLYSLRQRQER